MTAAPVPDRLGPVKRVTCSCGYVAVGETADELLARVETHIDDAHRPDRADDSAPAPAPAPTTTTEAQQ